ncbi:hypothetical protein [Leucobacter soli]|uniref:hypothetical protein n=1 Tax=Leucobacter soli TaxID=2812850 RepID=UPI00361FDDE0
MSDASGRLALLRATVVIVARGGLRALTYRAVAAEAGVSTAWCGTTSVRATS